MAEKKTAQQDTETTDKKTSQQDTETKIDAPEILKEEIEHWRERGEEIGALWGGLGPKLEKARSVPEAAETIGKTIFEQIMMGAQEVGYHLDQIARTFTGSPSKKRPKDES
jgi:hypothetical protein